MYFGKMVESNEKTYKSDIFFNKQYLKSVKMLK